MWSGLWRSRLTFVDENSFLAHECDICDVEIMNATISSERDEKGCFAAQNFDTSWTQWVLLRHYSTVYRDLSRESTAGVHREGSMAVSPEEFWN